MNLTVIQLTVKSLLGRKRALLLVALALVVVGLALLFRATAGQDDGVAVGFVGGFALGTVVPLVCLIAGTGAISTDIDDGSIVYLLAKPLRRGSIIVSKLVVAIGCSLVFGALPVLLSGLLLVGSSERIAVAYAVGASIAGVVYSALFLLFGVIARNAAIVGLLYALIWETTIAGFVPGARSLSVRHWALSVIERVMGSDLARMLNVHSDVSFGIAMLLLVCVFSLSTWQAARRLRTIRLATSE